MEQIDGTTTHLTDAEQAAAWDGALDAMSRPRRRRRSRRQYLLVILVLVGFFFSILDTTIVSTSLLASSEDLKDFRDGSWVVLAYLLTYMGFSTIIAKLSDHFGRRNLLIISWVIFTISSVACGCSITMTQLIIFRAFQGIGGAGLYSLTTIVMPEVGPADHPEIIGKMVGMTLAGSFILGPILGGVIPQLSSWRWIYWLNAPFCLLTTVGLVFLYPRDTHHLERRRDGVSVLKRIDFIGGILLMGSSMLLIFALQQAGSMVFPWTSLPISMSLFVSGVCFMLFCGWEWFLFSVDEVVEPIFPLRLLRIRAYIACLVTTLLVGYVYLTLVIAIPERFQIVNGDGILKTGVHLLPMLGATAVGSFLSGPINAKKNRTAIVVVVSCVFMLVGTSLFTAVDTVDYPVPPQYGFQTVFGLGFGLFMSSGTMLSTAQAPLGDHAASQGAVAQIRLLGGALGLALFTIIFNSSLQGELAAGLTPEQLDTLHQSPSALVALWPDLQGLVQNTYAEAFATMTKTMAGVMGAALVVSFFTLQRNPPLIHGNFVKDKEFPTSRGHGGGVGGGQGDGQSELEMNDLGSDRSVYSVAQPPAVPASVLSRPPPALRRAGSGY